MRDVGRLVRLELFRLATSRRWVLVLAAAVLVAWLAGEALEIEAVNSQVRAGALDVHAAAVNNLMYVGYLFFAAFVFLVGDTVVCDRQTGYARLMSARGVGRRQLWASKVISVGIAAAIAQAGLLGVCVGYGALVLGLPVARGPSALARATPGQLGLSLFPPVPPDVHMGLRQIQITAYLWLPFVALAVALVVLSIRFESPRLPLSLALLGLMADHVAAKGWEPWRFVSPGLRLLEGTGEHFAGEVLLSRGSSVTYFAAVLAAAVWTGGVLLDRMEL